MPALLRAKARVPVNPPKVAAAREPKDTVPRSPVARLTVLAPKALALAKARVPAATRVAPAAVLAPARVKVPLPVLVRPPCPLTAPFTVRLAAAPTEIAESATRATLRLVASVALTEEASVPPANVRAVWATAGTAPRAASDWIANVPAAMVTPPVKVFAPVRRKVPEPALVRLAAAAPSARTELRVKVAALFAWVRMNSLTPEVSVPPVREAAAVPVPAVTRRPPLARVAVPARLTVKPPVVAKRSALAEAPSATVLLLRTSTLVPVDQVSPT